ncbi:MAG TPA: sodium:calcium antiporter, partial [Hyphomonas sp.]|nr:sodium:calcium antiporter [Hyphomonas sp.]
SKLNISELVIGLTLVGFGTSVPELVTSLRAINEGAVGIAVGNVVGSNIANILLVLGVAALIHPIITNPRALMRDTSIMVIVTALLCVLIWFDLFSRLAGFVLVACLLGYIAFSVFADQAAGDEVAEMHAGEGETVEANYGVVKGVFIALAGLVGVVFGAKLLVDGGVVIAREFGISETVIGLSIVAVGTSLPELATSAIAAFRGKADVALGNIIGSNIFNILGILGLTALVHPFSVRSMPSGDVTTDALASGAGHSL